MNRKWRGRRQEGVEIQAEHASPGTKALSRAQGYKTDFLRNLGVEHREGPIPEGGGRSCSVLLRGWTSLCKALLVMAESQEGLLRKGRKGKEMGFLQLRTRCFDVRIQPLQQHVQLPHIQFPHHQPNCWRSLSSCRSVSSLFGIATASAHLYFEFMHISGSLLLGKLSELGGVYFVVTGSPALLCAGAVSISPKPAQFVPMDSSTPFSNWVLLGIVCIFTASAYAVHSLSPSEPLFSSLPVPSVSRFTVCH